MVNNNSVKKIKTTGANVHRRLIAGPNGEMDWMAGLQDDEGNKYVNELTECL